MKRKGKCRRVKTIPPTQGYLYPVGCTVVHTAHAPKRLAVVAGYELGQAVIEYDCGLLYYADQCFLRQVEVVND